MSAGHTPHYGPGGSGSLIIDRLLDKPEISHLLHRWSSIDRSHDIPYLGGYSRDGHMIYIDRHLPDTLHATIDGKSKEFDPVRFIRCHEAMEKALIDGLGWNYEHAHQLATGYERREVLKAGIFWKPYQEAVRPFIKAAEHEQIKRVPRDLDMTPYSNPHLIAVMQKAMEKGDDNRKQKSDVDYSDRGMAKSHCGPVAEWPKGQCAHFVPPAECARVRGHISPRGWCRLWIQVSER